MIRRMGPASVLFNRRTVQIRKDGPRNSVIAGRCNSVHGLRKAPKSGGKDNALNSRFQRFGHG